MKLTDEQTITAATDIALILASLSALPTAEIAESWGDSSLPESLRTLASYTGLPEAFTTALNAYVADPKTPSDLSALRQDFTHLFTHPKHPIVPYFESHFLAQKRGETEKPLLVVNRTAVALDETYRNAGFTHRAGSTISGDRLDIELTFLALLLERGNVEAAEAFVADHLAQWAPAIFARIANEAITPEYRLIGVLGQSFFA